mmetsp:Transcript_35888/g.88369  ORF Transcript_35888/g.88369 Transcript_35888/m.88369 type:complete len:203 (+) Transcript_35888:678-1286(+)
MEPHHVGRRVVGLERAAAPCDLAVRVALDVELTPPVVGARGAWVCEPRAQNLDPQLTRRLESTRGFAHRGLGAHHGGEGIRTGAEPTRQTAGSGGGGGAGGDGGGGAREVVPHDVNGGGGGLGGALGAQSPAGRRFGSQFLNLRHGRLGGGGVRGVEVSGRALERRKCAFGVVVAAAAAAGWGLAQRPGGDVAGYEHGSGAG